MRRIEIRRKILIKRFKFIKASLDYLLSIVFEFDVLRN